MDVEDYFQVSAFENHIARDKWNSLPCRVDGNTNRILDLFAKQGVSATFFILGWVAERYPKLVKRIQSEGHEVASHGYSHMRVTQLQPDDFRNEVIRTKELLEDISGEPVKGYRAPSYSINASNLWALDILCETGHQYSSSIYPVRHDLYGMPNAPRFAHYPRDNDLLEIPISTTSLLGWKMPCGGGGFFRLFPYQLSRWAINRINSSEKSPSVFYFHPWEIDPDQPKQQGLQWRTRFRHYLNLHRTEQRITQLLKDFSWGRMDDVYLNQDAEYPHALLMEADKSVSIG